LEEDKAVVILKPKWRIFGFLRINEATLIGTTSLTNSTGQLLDSIPFHNHINL